MVDGDGDWETPGPSPPPSVVTTRSCRGLLTLAGGLVHPLGTPPPQRSFFLLGPNPNPWVRETTVPIFHGNFPLGPSTPTLRPRKRAKQYHQGHIIRQHSFANSSSTFIRTLGRGICTFIRTFKYLFATNVANRKCEPTKEARSLWHCGTPTE